MAHWREAARSPVERRKSKRPKGLADIARFKIPKKICKLIIMD